MTDRLTRWEGADENGPRAVLAKEGRFPDVLEEALRKLARYEDKEEPTFLPIVGKPIRELDQHSEEILSAQNPAEQTRDEQT